MQTSEQKNNAEKNIQKISENDSTTRKCKWMMTVYKMSICITICHHPNCYTNWHFVHSCRLGRNAVSITVCTLIHQHFTELSIFVILSCYCQELFSTQTMLVNHIIIIQRHNMSSSNYQRLSALHLTTQQTSPATDFSKVNLCNNWKIITERTASIQQCPNKSLRH